MAIATKADLVLENEQLQARIAELEAAIREVVTQPEAPKPQADERPERNKLVQRIWLQRQMPANTKDRQNVGVTTGGSPFIQFGAGYSDLDRLTGEKAHAPYKRFVAYGELAEAAKEIFSSPNRLVDIEAFEKPIPNDRLQKGPDGRFIHKSQWIVTAIRPATERMQPLPAPAPAPAPAPTPEPSLEEVPF